MGTVYSWITDSAAETFATEYASASVPVDKKAEQTPSARERSKREAEPPKPKSKEDTYENLADNK